MPAVTMLRPKTHLYYSTTPIHCEYENDANDFISSASIPKTHMPREALQRQVKKGWDTAHYPRYMSVHNGKDTMRYSQWNSLS